MDSEVGTPLRVLIADDDPIIRLDLKQMLENLGYSVIAEAGDGAQATRLATELRPDICILDVKMPSMDGVDVAHYLAETYIAPVVLLTAYGDRELVDRAKNAGVFGYIVKPFKSGDLVPAIEIARSRFEQNKQLRSEVTSLQERLEARKQVERAKGLLMTQHNLTESEAYRRIQLQAMQHRKTMREVAEAIILTYDVCDTE